MVFDDPDRSCDVFPFLVSDFRFFADDPALSTKEENKKNRKRDIDP